MKIIFQCNELPPGSSGGIGVFTHNIATELSLRGNSVIIIGIYDHVFTVDAPYQVVFLKRIKGLGLIGRILNIVKFQFYLYYFLRFVEKDVDIIEYPDYGAYGSLHFSSVPFIVRLHNSSFFAKGKYYGSNWNKINDSIPWYLQKISIIRAKRVIAVANHTSRSVERLTNRKDILVIYNFINRNSEYSDSFDRSKLPPIFFLNVGSVNTQKGALLLMQAFEKIETELSNVSLVFLGRKNDSGIQKYYNGLSEKLKKRVVFISEVKNEDVSKYIGCSLAGFFPSFNENLPLAWLDFMQVGKPIVVSRIPISSEIIEEGVNGFTFDLNIDSISNAMLNMVNLSEENYSNLELSCKKYFNSKFNKEIILDKNIQVFNNINN